MWLLSRMRPNVTLQMHELGKTTVAGGADVRQDTSMQPLVATQTTDVDELLSTLTAHRRPRSDVRPLVRR